MFSLVITAHFLDMVISILHISYFITRKYNNWVYKTISVCLKAIGAGGGSNEDTDHDTND